uniref:Leucine rich repeat containing 43 n=1 Tax=Poecilia formosa TaxID=48698 RepID=A0A087YJ66_POEFO
MSSTTLSVAIDKKIRRLCLTDFPCGIGPWVSFHCPAQYPYFKRQTKNGPDEARTESPDVLLDLLRYPRSPWMYNDTWSPQASDLRELAVREPKRFSKDFILNYFTTIRITGKNVSFIDERLLKFSKLEELVLSGNLISEIPAKHLPDTLKILELRANRLSSLSGLASCPPPQLQYLGLGSNSLGSHQDVCDLTGRHWPRLACLDLSNCNFQEQRLLVATLETLPCLKTLTLKGNPFTMTPSYPGFTVDSLPQLSCLDSSWLTTEERYNFFGLARINDLVEDVASVTLSLTRLRGIPDPLMYVDKKAVEFPVVTYKYFVSYQFFSHNPYKYRSNKNVKNFKMIFSSHSPLSYFSLEEMRSTVTLHGLSRSRLVSPAGRRRQPGHVVSRDRDPGSDRNTGKNVSALDTADVPAVDAYETEQRENAVVFLVLHILGLLPACLGSMMAPHGFAHVGPQPTWALYVSLYATPKLPWSECADLNYTLAYRISCLGDLKKFFTHGLHLNLMEEKILSWPAPSEEAQHVKPSPTKDKKGKSKEKANGKESPLSRQKNSEKLCPPELVHDPPIRKLLNSVHIPMQSLVQGGQRVSSVCDFGPLHVEPPPKQEEETEKKPKGKGKDAKKRDMDEHTVPPVPVPPVPVTVELSVELEKWKSVSDA